MANEAYTPEYIASQTSQHLVHMRVPCLFYELLDRSHHQPEHHVLRTTRTFRLGVLVLVCTLTL